MKWFVIAVASVLATFAFDVSARAQCGAGGCGAGRASSRMGHGSMGMGMMASKYNGGRMMRSSTMMVQQPQMIERRIIVQQQPMLSVPVPAPTVQREIRREIVEAPVVERRIVERQVFVAEPVSVPASSALIFGPRGRLRGVATPVGPVVGAVPARAVLPRRAVVVLP